MIVYHINTQSVLELAEIIARIKKQINPHSWCVTRDWDSDQSDSGVLAFFDREGLRIAEIREGERKR